MDQKTTGIIATVATAVLCGLPGLLSVCIGAMMAIVSRVPGAEIDVVGSSDPAAAVGVGLGMLCLGVIGVAIPVKFLISFEFLLAVGFPGILAFFIINGRRYSQFKQPLDMALLITWVWLGITIIAYFVYFISGNAAALWAKGIWFTENDVLHIGLILWMFYITFSIAPKTRDLA